jgi:ribosomal protein S18 acetylase RimI-like enzyme
MRIIDCETGHVEAVLEIRREVRADTYANEAIGASRQYLLDRNTVTEALVVEEVAELSGGEARCWVAEENGTVLGYLKAYQEPRQFIDIIHVLPAHQGNRIGPQLMEKALAWFDLSKPTYLEVVEGNDYASEWYERHGWQRTGKTLGETPLPNGGYIQAFEMVLLPARAGGDDS